MWVVVVSVFLFLSYSDAERGTEVFLADSEFDEFDHMNLSADPCEDFYEYTCGNFKTNYPLKKDDILIDHFTILEDRLTEIVYEILKPEIKEFDPISLQKAKAAYHACVDEHFMDNQYMTTPEKLVIEKYGGFPIIEMSNRWDGKEFGWYEIADLAAENGINIFFDISIYADPMNASVNLIRIVNDNMNIPEQIRPIYPQSYEEAVEEGFFNFATSNSKHRKTGERAYKQPITPFELFLRKLVLKIRDDMGSWETEEYIFDRVANISNFMKGIYYGGVVPNHDIGSLPEVSFTLKQLNDWTIEQFGDSIELDWVEYMKRIFQYTYVDINENTTMLGTKDLNKTIYGILNWVQMNDPSIVKSTALLRAFVYMAADSDKETRDYFEDYLKAIKKIVYPRWEYCTRKIMDATGTLSLSFAVTYEYQKKYFNTTNIQSALEMIDDLLSSFKEIIKDAEWMDEESKTAALKKADNIITLLGYPAFVRNQSYVDQFYENLDIRLWDNYHNARQLRAFKNAHILNTLSKRERKFWEKSPFDTNAYYNRQNNRIIFPVAMLNPIFFGGSISLLDYSRIGMIIAHEITHGFDGQGYLYDENGVIKIWWTTYTRINFENKKQCFIDQYDQYTIPEINATLSGKNSLNENLADNGGARTAFRALSKKLLPRIRQKYGFVPRLEKFTSEQLFFIGFGTMWCNNESIQYLNLLNTSCASSGCHARAKLRVNGVVSNMAEFSEAFSCPVGSPMNPETKCKLW